MAKIDTVESRKKLVIRSEPYWQRLTTLCYLGFRKTDNNGGTWKLRIQTQGVSERSYATFGTFDTLPEGARFDAAKRAAEVHLKHLELGGSVDAITVGNACERLVLKYKNEGNPQAAKDADGRFKRWVYSNKKLASTPIQRLTATMLSDWRNTMAATPAKHQDKTVVSVKPRAASTVNRDMAVLKIALNLAHEDGYVTSKHAWSTKLKPIKDATGKRDCYLDINQRLALMEHATPDLAILINAMSVLPLRPGAVANLKVSNFDKRQSTLVVGKDKAGKDRVILLPESTAKFCASHVKNRPSSAPLFVRAGGNAWNKDSWKYPFKDAVVAANLPSDATAYAIRHSTITDLITGGLDTMTVARISGTSIQMIESHYGHLKDKHAMDALARLELRRKV